MNDTNKPRAHKRWTQTKPTKHKHNQTNISNTTQTQEQVEATQKQTHTPNHVYITKTHIQTYNNNNNMYFYKHTKIHTYIIQKIFKHVHKKNNITKTKLTRTNIIQHLKQPKQINDYIYI